MSRRPRDRSRLEARLGYRFADPELLDRALTHSSAVSPGKRIANSYQRLEFLGDRVLGLVIADLLYRKLPKANEGELSRSLNALVRKESCAAIARRLDLGPDLNLGESEARTGGAQKDAILGDVTEAIIGAVYCDGGLGKAYELIERLFGDQIGLANSDRADAKTTLQEWAQGRGMPAPIYQIVGRSGPDHAPRFEVEVGVDTLTPCRGEGRTRREAEQDAAAAMLARQGLWPEAANG
jgi:ribonuclease-3